MPQFSDDVHVQGAASISGAANTTTQVLRLASGQTQPFLQLVAADGVTVLSQFNADGRLAGVATPEATQRILTGSSMYHLYDTGSRGSNSWSVGAMIAVPFPADRAATIDRLGVHIGTGGVAGAVVRLGAYADDGNGRPGSLIADGGTIDGTSATYQEVTVAAAISAPMAWLTMVMQVATCSIGCQNNLLMGTKILTNPLNLLTFGHIGFTTPNGSVTGALPATFGPIVTSDGNTQSPALPLIVARIV